jgi:hypothetical protein
MPKVMRATKDYRIITFGTHHRGGVELLRDRRRALQRFEHLCRVYRIVTLSVRSASGWMLLLKSEEPGIG